MDNSINIAINAEYAGKLLLEYNNTFGINLWSPRNIEHVIFWLYNKILSEKEIYSGACVVIEDKSVSFPMLGVYPSIKDYPYFVIWRHMPTHEKTGRSADMLYWNGKQNISNKAKIFVSEIAGQFSSSTSETSVCWSGGKNNLCYKNPSR